MRVSTATVSRTIHRLPGQWSLERVAGNLRARRGGANTAFRIKKAAIDPHEEALLEAISQALAAVTTEDAHGFFGHCGYEAEAQPS